MGVLSLLGDFSACREDKQGRPSQLQFHDSGLQVMGFPHCLAEGVTWVRQGSPPLIPKGAGSLASHRGYLPVSTTPGVMGRLLQKTRLRSILGPQEECIGWGVPGGSVVKNPPALQEAWVQSLCRENHLKKEMAAHSSILAWSVPWTEEPGRLQSMGSQRVGQDLATEHICMCASV